MPAVEEDAFTPVWAAGTQLLHQLDLTWDRLVNVEAASYATGITPDRIALRLQGGTPDHERPRFSERLRFLRETRRDARGKKHSLRTIAAMADGSLTYAAVAHLESGRNEPGREVAAALERAFNVPVGWCSLSEGEALAAYVAPLVNQLRAALRAVNTWAQLRARDVEAVSLRGAADPGKMPDLLTAILPTVLPELDQVLPPEADR
ncbi:helix-turn-helix transcriptional regulator [Streptomyces sp. NPDC006385]|uniref:helix-turn-helix domain-containing protein n=1 Tax=Streptomyces sp. NPDC006385 TaxID=3156761 RepID=UPI0033BE36F2